MDQLAENPEPDVPALGSPGSSDTFQSRLGVRVFQNTAALLGGRVVGLCFSAGTSILLARYLGPERLGQFGAIYAYLALYGFFATFCLEQILARETTLRRHQAAEIFHTATLTALGFSLSGAILAPLLAPLFGYPGPLRWLIAIAAVDMLILPPLRFRGIIFQVEMRLWYSVGIGLFRQALWLLAVLLLILKSAAFYEVILARTLCGFVEAALVFWTVHRLRLIRGPKRFLASEARFLIREGFPLVLSSVAVGIYHLIDQVMLHKMSGDRVLGPYVIAVQLTELFSVLPVALMGSLFPALSQSAGDPPRFERYLRESYRFLLVLVFAACAFVTPVASPFVELFYGKQFLPTAPLLIVLVWSEIPVFFGVIMSNAMVAKGVQRWLPVTTVLGAVCNVIMNLILIPRFGALGASWATVVSYSLAGIFLLLFFSDTRSLVLPGLRIATPLLVLVLALTALLHLSTWSPWLKLAAVVVFYFAGALGTRSLLRSDLHRVWMMILNRSS